MVMSLRPFSLSWIAIWPIWFGGPVGTPLNDRDLAVLAIVGAAQPNQFVRLHRRRAGTSLRRHKASPLFGDFKFIWITLIPASTGLLDQLVVGLHVDGVENQNVRLLVDQLAQRLRAGVDVPIGIADDDLVAEFIGLALHGGDTSPASDRSPWRSARRRPFCL